MYVLACTQVYWLMVDVVDTAAVYCFCSQSTHSVFRVGSGIVPSYLPRPSHPCIRLFVCVFIRSFPRLLPPYRLSYFVCLFIHSFIRFFPFVLFIV